jgi:hypothetical protein
MTEQHPPHPSFNLPDFCRRILVSEQTRKKLIEIGPLSAAEIDSIVTVYATSPNRTPNATAGAAPNPGSGGTVGRQSE